MKSSNHSEPAPELLNLPQAVARVGERLSDAGHRAYLVGPSVCDLLSENPPSHFEISTDAPLECIAVSLPESVLLDKHYQTFMCPTSAGPVDVTPFRATARGEAGARVEDDLPHRDFSINAMAYGIADHELIDPYGGQRDLADGVLCAVGVARDCLAEDPVRGLRALRLVATRGLKLHPELEAALGTVRSSLAKIPREPVRREFSALLLAPGVAQALAELERCGIASDLAPDAPAGAGAVVERLPCDLALRLAGWLRGTAPRRPLQKLRFTRPLIDRVESLLRVHPVDTAVGNASDGALIHFVRRTGIRDVSALITLREAEIEASNINREDDREPRRDFLGRLREIAQEFRISERKARNRDQLAMTGSDVMKILGCPPGPGVGHALAYLAERIALEPSLNSFEKLETALRDWGSVDE
jgi:tRNA nucleotidyltransferase/poly(A) polymerase